MKTRFLTLRIFTVGICLLLIGVLLTACQAVVPMPVVSAQPVETEADMEEIAQEVQAFWDEYATTNVAGDIESWIDLWDKDGVKMIVGWPAIEGRDNLLAFKQARSGKAEVTSMAITNQDVKVAGDWAFVRGVYDQVKTPVDGSDPIVIDGWYSSILKRDQDGNWKLYWDTCASQVPPAAPPEVANAALSADLHARFSANDLEGALTLADENIEMIGYGLGLDLKGKDQFLKFMQARKTAFPDITVEHTNLVAEGDQVAVEFVASGTHTGPLMTPAGEIPPTGKPVTLNVLEIHTWRDGKLVKIVQYQDASSTLRQIGALD